MEKESEKKIADIEGNQTKLLKFKSFDDDDVN